MTDMNGPELLKLLMEAADMAAQKGDHKLAESLYIHAVKQAQNIYSEKDPELREILTAVASYYDSQGRHKEADHFRTTVR